MRAGLAIAAAVLLGASTARGATEHDAPFFPERMRPVMEWVDRERHRDDPFLLLSFRAFDAPASVNHSKVLDGLTGYAVPGDGFQGAGGPADGATYGFMVGKDTWHVVYDSVHRLLYYGEGCCSFGYSVLMRARAAAPRTVPRRDLRGMRTARGIRLGMTAREVQAREGPALRTLGPTRSGRTALAYTTPIGRGTSSCAEQRTFVFDRGRLEAIDVLRGC